MLAGILPLALLAHFAFVAGLAAPHHWQIPHILLQTYFWFSVGPQFALAALIGVTIASGFAPGRHREPSKHVRHGPET